MDWLGVNRKVYPVWRDGALAIYQQNLRMRVHGELQRRNGMASSNVAKQATPIYNLIPVADPSGSGIIVVPSGGNVLGFTGTSAPVAKWNDIKPIIPPGGGSCTLFATLTDTGTTSKNAQLNPPADSCVGSIVVLCSESGSGQGFTPYGYQFTIECFGPAGLIATYASTCLINSGATYVMPAGTINVSYDITGGCNGGSTPGNWAINVSTP